MATRRIPSKMGCCIALAAVLAQVETADAQGLVRVSPLFRISQMYDSNPFSVTSDPQVDFVTRVTPGLESEYRSALVTLLGRYTHDLERFADHPDLSSTAARAHATIDATYHPARRFALAGGVEFSTTHTPGELNGESGLAFTRAAARRLAAHSSITRQFGRVTTGTIDYTFAGDRVAGGVASQSHSVDVGTRHRVSQRDTMNADYRVHWFLFTSSASAMTSHAFTVGWTHAISRQARLSIDAGPQVANGSPAAEVSASVRYHVRPLNLSLTYGRAQTTIIGLTGTARTQSITGSAAWSLLRDSLHVQVSPAFFQSAHPLLQADVYRLGVDVDHQIADGLTIGLALDMNLQHNRDAILTRTDIARQTVMIRLVAAPAARH